MSHHQTPDQAFHHYDLHSSRVTTRRPTRPSTTMACPPRESPPDSRSGLPPPWLALLVSHHQTPDQAFHHHGLHSSRVTTRLPTRPSTTMACTPRESPPDARPGLPPPWLALLESHHQTPDQAFHHHGLHSSRVTTRRPTRPSTTMACTPRESPPDARPGLPPPWLALLESHHQTPDQAFHHHGLHSSSVTTRRPTRPSTTMACTPRESPPDARPGLPPPWLARLDTVNSLQAALFSTLAHFLRRLSEDEFTFLNAHVSVNQVALVRAAVVAVATLYHSKNDQRRDDLKYAQYTFYVGI